MTGKLKFFRQSSRRGFCASVGGAAIGLVAAKLPLGGEQVIEVPAAGDDDFIIVNGWVLTRKDLAPGE